MKRILFVDDEQQVLDGLRDALRKQRQKWEMVFAPGGKQALAEIAKSGPFDVVVSDMRMPEMDGAELLRRVKELQPGAVRIVLSGQAEQDLVLRALPVSHQYLSKPCPPDLLRQVIERACELSALLPDPDMQKLVANLTSLPALPASYWELMQTIARPNAGLGDVCRIIERDPALHAKVLQLANSAFFGLAQRVSSIASAINFLGLELIKAMAVANHVFSAGESAPKVPGFSLESLQRGALVVGGVAKQLVDTKHGNDAFAAGLLRDIGKLIFALALPERFGEALQVSRTERRPLHLVEPALLGASHAEVGAYLLGTWGLPVPIVLAVAHHHTPQKTGDNVGITLAVHIADALVEQALDPENASLHELDLPLLATLTPTVDLAQFVARGREIVAKRVGPSAEDQHRGTP